MFMILILIGFLLPNPKSYLRICLHDSSLYIDTDIIFSINTSDYKQA